MEGLNEFELEVLKNLPVEPTGLSLAELADGLLDDRGPAAKGKVRHALENISRALDGLYVGAGRDDFGGFGVKMFGIRRRRMPDVRRFFAEKAERAEKQLVHV